jgi:hypothetical protein
MDEMMLHALINDQDEFVMLFLDSGINLKKFITIDRLDTLYEKVSMSLIRETGSIQPSAIATSARRSGF